MKGRTGKHWEAYRGRTRKRKDQHRRRPKPIHSRAMAMAKMRFEQMATRERSKYLKEMEKYKKKDEVAQPSL